MSGFQDAGFTKGVMLFLGVNTLAASLLDLKPYLHVQLVPHITKYHQVWRVIFHPFAFANSTELLVGELLLYNLGVAIERSFGTRKFAAFALISSAITTFISSCAILFLYRFGINSFPSGPYGLIFSLIWQYYRTIPSLYSFKVLSAEFSSNSFNYVLAAQLVLSNPPGSILVSLAGLIAGYVYRTDTLFPVPSLSFSRSRQRRTLKPLKAYRIPLSVYLLTARIFSPILGASAPPRRSHRVLPGQRGAGSSGSYGGSRAEAAGGGVGGVRSGAALRQLLAGRGLGGTSLTTPARRAPGINRGSTTPGTPLAGGAGAAVGEWVDDLTGRGSVRAPTEQEISALSNMFPNMSRDTIVGALQRSEHNTALAVEALLEQSG